MPRGYNPILISPKPLILPGWYGFDPRQDLTIDPLGRRAKVTTVTGGVQILLTIVPSVSMRIATPSTKFANSRRVEETPVPISLDDSLYKPVPL